MSHIATIDIEFKDLDCLQKACDKLGFKLVKEGKSGFWANVRQYEGILINIPGWNYPVIVQEGQIVYDNHYGKWGNMQDIYDLKTYYGVEKTKKLATRNGYQYKEVMNGRKPQIRIIIGKK